MTPQEIKVKVDGLYDELQKTISDGIFVLNPHIEEIYNEIDKLEEQCIHEYGENDQCIYCYHLKEDD